MAVNLPFVANPGEDPYLLNLDTPSTTVDPTQDPNTQLADLTSTGTPSVDGVPLSGDNQPVSPTTTGGDTGLPFVPPSTPAGFAGWGDTQTTPPSNGPAGFAGWPEDIKQAPLPKAQAQTPTGPPAPTFGTDTAGSILTAERNLPGGEGTQAFVHGAQSQALPLAGAIGGGFLGGALTGMALGSVAPGVGTVVGGLIGGLIGYWLADQAQAELGKNLVPQQTMDALRAQTDYEQKNFPLQYGIGQLVPQLVGFHPSATAIADSFRLVGRVSGIPGVTAKLSELGLPQNHAALNQLVMMAWGTGQTGIQAQQQIAQGNFQPGLLAINLIGSTLFTQPNKWVGRLVPALRDPALQAHAKAIEEDRQGHAQVMDEYASLLSNDPEALQMAEGQKARWDQIQSLVSSDRRGEAGPVIDEYNRVSAELDRRLGDNAQTVTPPAQVAPAEPEAMVHPRRPEPQVLRTIPPTEIAPGQPERMSELAKLADTPEKLLTLLKRDIVTPAEADKIAALNQFQGWVPTKNPATGINPMLRQRGVPTMPEEAAQVQLNQEAPQPEPPPIAPEVAPQAAPRATPEELAAAQKAANGVAKDITDRVLQRGREISQEFPPEPRKETTPGGVSTGIRNAVLASPAAEAASEALMPLGEVHVVGGAIRNLIVGKPIKDLDLTFSGSEEKLIQGLDSIGDAEFTKTGEQFPVYRLRVGDDEVEIALHRTENPENQHSFATGENIPISEDLQRRDFTVNGMAVNVRTGEFVDPNNGLKHSQSQSLNLVNPKSFAGDPVRMLRALRFIGDGYHAGKKLLESMKENASLLANMPAERIQTELDRIFSSEKPGKALEAMRESGILDHIFPEHLKTVGFDQRSTHHNQLLWDHIMGVVNKTSEFNADPDVRMAAFLHDISKPDTQTPRPDGRMSYLGHEDVGAETSKRILTSLKYPNDRIDKIVFLVKNHMFAQARVLAHPAGFVHDMSKDLMGMPVEDRRAIVDQRIKDLMDIRRADQANHPVNRMDIEGMKKALDAIGHKPIERPASNIDGNDLIDLGLKPGPQFRDILSQLDDEVLYRGLPNEPDSLLARAKEITGKGNALQYRREVPFDANPWPQVRKAVLDQGGIGPSKDWPNDWIPGDLYRANGKPPDRVAAETTIGRADTPPWGEGGDDSAMMSYLRNAYEQHQKLQKPPVPEEPRLPEISANEAHGDSMLVSADEFQRLATEGKKQLDAMKGKTRPTTGLDKNWQEIVQDAFAQIQQSWGGVTIDPQTGRSVAPKEGFALSAREPVQHPVILNESSSLQQFADGMNSARREFQAQLGRRDFYLGVFHDDNAHTIEIDPVVIVKTRKEVDALGAYTHAVGGAYDFASGNGHFPPHVSEQLTTPQRTTLIHYSAKPRSVIDPNHAGSGQPGEEFNRTGPNSNAKARFASYYEQGQRPERFFGEGTPYPVKHTVTGDFKILDLNSVEGRNLRRAVAAENPNAYERGSYYPSGIFNKHEFDNAAQAAGFDGYKSNGTVRLFGKRSVSHINDIPIGETNGIQQETAGQQEASGQTSGGGETSFTAQIGNGGQVGHEEPTSPTSDNEVGGTSGNATNEQPTQGSTALNFSSSGTGQFGSTATSTLPPPTIRAGDLRPNAGDAARAVGATDAFSRGNATSARTTTDVFGTSDFAATTRASRDRQAAQLGTTNAEQSSQAGTPGWTSSSDLGQEFVQSVHDIAQAMGVDMAQAPQFRGSVRMLPAEHEELLRFSQKPNDETNRGNVPLNKATLFIPDDPALVPGAHMGDAKDWQTLLSANKLVDGIRLHEKGNPTLEYLPAKITDDATRVSLILKGWANRFFYDNARTFPDSLTFDKASDKAIWRASQPVFGDKMSVLLNARSVINFNSMMKAGVFRNLQTGEQFDHDIFQSFVDAGIIKNFSQNGISRDNLIRAAQGLMPETLKVGDFGGAMNGEARAPVDMWKARLAFGKDNTPTTKMYEYEFGRNNFLTRMFSAFDPNILPSHIQSAEWFGYQRLVSERLAEIKQAAMATGDTRLIEMAKGIRSNLESKDLAEVFRDYHGLTAGATPRILPFHTILANPRYRESLISLSKEFFSRRYLRGKLGSHSGQDVLDVQQIGRVSRVLDQTPEFRKALADYYKTYFVDTKTVRTGPGAATQSLDRAVGPIALRLMEIAHSMQYPRDAQELGRAAADLAGVSSISERDMTVANLRDKLIDRNLRQAGKDVEASLAQTLADLHDQFGLPRGLIGLNSIYAHESEGVASWDPNHPNQVNINLRLFHYFEIVKAALAPKLQRQLASNRELTDGELIKAKRVIDEYARGDDLWIRKRILAHELAHAIQGRLYGNQTLGFGSRSADHEIAPAAFALLEHMTPRYMVGLVREGLGNELEALLQVTQSSLNEFVGGIEGAPLKGEPMPLGEAVTNLLEHQADQWAIAHNMGDYSRATPEVYRRNVYEPKIAEENARELRRIWERALKVSDDSLAVEAESQLSGRGPNPAIDSSLLEPEESSAGIAAYAKLPEGNSLQSSTSGWFDASSSDQDLGKLLTFGERMLNIKQTADALREKMASPTYKPVYGDRETLAELDNKVADLQRAIHGPEQSTLRWPVSDPRLPAAQDPWLQKATAQAVARIQKQPGEGDAGFAQRLVKASGAYSDLDHALQVARSARDGAWTPVMYGNKVGFKVNNRFYTGTPGDHVANWAGEYHDAIHTLVDGVPNEVFANEPQASGIGEIHPEQLSASFVDQYQPDPNPRVGAVSITSKTGEEIPIPSFSPHHFLWARNADMPTSKLSANSAANKVKAHFEAVQTSLDQSEDLLQKGLFDPEVVTEEKQRLAEAGEGLPPARPPLDGGGGGGEEPPIGGGGRPPKGQTPEERKLAEQKAVLANSGLVLRDYLSALKDSLQVDDPFHRTVTAGINDLISQALKTFDTRAWYNDSRTWVVDATNAMHSFSRSYERVGTEITNRIAALEAKSPNANNRILEVFYSKQGARQELLKGMSDEEAFLANHLHAYWSVLGDVLKRAGLIKTAIENYVPLMIEKPEAVVRPGLPARNYSSKSVHQIARRKVEEGPDIGRLLFESPAELQAWADDQALGWKVRTDVGGIFKAQGNSVTQALTMRHTIDQLAKNSEVQVGKTPAETAPPILTQQRLRDHPIASENRSQYVRSTSMIGKWKNALNYTRWLGDQKVVEDYWVHKKLANVMEREATQAEMPGDIITNTAKVISHVNQLWKTWQFFLTPMHEFSLLGNVSAHAGLNPIGIARIVRDGGKIVNDPASQEIFNLLTRAGGPDNPPELGGFQAMIPGYKGYHDFIWKTTMYNGTYGLGRHLMQEHLDAWAANHPGQEITPADRFDAAKVGMDAAKKAMGSVSSIDMSKNWSLWGNVLFLANKWTTGQLRTVGEAVGFGPMARLGGAIPLEGHSAESTAFMQRRQMAMSQRLLIGGMVRLAVLGTITSTAISALVNNGQVSTPFDNFQKDPGRTFDIYAGRDPATGKDRWYRMPFYLFQREMIDWVLSSVKAATEGKEWVDTGNLGDSVLAAPFVKFAGKLDPITKLSLETLTGTELAGWMKGFTNSQIDSDTYIQNVNKSLQMMGFRDGGSLENRLINAIQAISPSISFPTNLKKPTNDVRQVLGALGIGIGPLSVSTGDVGSVVAPFLGSTQMPGTTYKVGPDGKVQPAWQIQQYYDNQTQLGQKILVIASTLGTGTVEQEKQKLEQMETLRQQANLSPGALTNLILHGDSIPTGQPGLLAQNLPPKTPAQAAHKPVQLSGKELTPAQEVAYNSVTFQRQSQAILQALADPTWKTMDASERAGEIATLKAFADRITNEQFSVAIGVKRANVISDSQASSMIAEFGLIKKATQQGLQLSPIYTAASQADQGHMMADRVAASENAVWQKYYSINSTMKGASDKTLAQYVALQGDLRDEVRQVIQKLPSYTRSLDPAAQAQELKLALTFADNLVNQSIQGKAPRAFGSPLTRSQLMVAVRNGIVLQDASLKELHKSFIYQEAPQADQLALDTKYVTLAHNVALYDTRMGVQEGLVGNNAGFGAILSTTLAADEGYQTLVEQFFGLGGRQVLAQRESELADLKARFRQENQVSPADLSRYDTLINNWYKQQNPDYANFLYYRTQWEKYDPLGQAYRATVQSNFGFESTNPLAISTPYAS